MVHHATDPNPISRCESLLRKEIAYNVEHAILRSENEIAERLLSRRPEMREAYEELCAKLPFDALWEFIRSILRTAAHWDPESIEEARSERKRLAQANAQISEKAAELAALLEERDRIRNSSSFGDDTHYHVCEVIEEASVGNGLFNNWVREELDALRCRYDLKYWPSLADFVGVLASDASNASVSAMDPLTEAGTSSQRASLADYFRTLLADIEDCSYGNGGPYPRGFAVSDKALAAIGNCALGLDDHSLVDAQYVKRLRQRQRQMKKRG